MATVRSIFAPYTERLDAIVDARIDDFAPTWFQSRFPFDQPQVSLTFVEAIGRSRVEAAASIVARGSEMPLRSRPALEKLQVSIPAIGEKFQMLEEDWRQYEMLRTIVTNDIARRDIMLNYIWNDTRKVGNSLLKGIDIMTLQGLSTGYIDATITNNPDGRVFDPIDLLMPADNRRNALINWNLPGTATPVEDIKAMVAYGKPKGITFGQILVSDQLLSKVLATTEVKEYMKTLLGVTNSRFLPTLDLLNTFLANNRLPVFEVVDVTVGLEKDGLITTYRPFSETNAVFVPSGNLGVIKNAVPIEALHPVQYVSYAPFFGGLISKWSDNEPFSEYTKGEINAFPAITSIDSICLLNTNFNPVQ